MPLVLETYLFNWLFPYILAKTLFETKKTYFVVVSTNQQIYLQHTVEPQQF